MGGSARPRDPLILFCPPSKSLCLSTAFSVALWTPQLLREPLRIRVSNIAADCDHAEISVLLKSPFSAECSTNLFNGRAMESSHEITVVAIRWEGCGAQKTTIAHDHISLSRRCTIMDFMIQQDTLTQQSACTMSPFPHHKPLGTGENRRVEAIDQSHSFRVPARPWLQRVLANLWR